MNDELLETLFSEILGVSTDQAEIDACKIEHLLSIESSMKLSAFLKVWNGDSKEAVAFRKRLQKAEHACEGDSESCTVCQTVCIKPAGS